MANVTITADGTVQVIKIGEVITGPPGSPGVDGKSAYQLALDGGFVGTQEQWIASLKGADGKTPVKGVDYFDGAPGKDGKPLTFNDLTEQQKAQLKGEKGDPGTTDYNQLTNKPNLALKADVSYVDTRYAILHASKADKSYVDAQDTVLTEKIDTGLESKVNKAGDTMTGNLIVPSITINDSSFLTGTGFPNGVVAAPVGSIYVDKNLTCGALLWIKQTGTGNTGWKVLSGDTGWLDCNAIFKPIFDDSDPLSTGCKLRRINNTVYFTIKSQVKTVSEISVSIKNGGFSSGNNIPQPIIIQQLRSANKSAQMQITNYSFMWLPGYAGCKVGDRVVCNSSYTTVADWPTTLTF